MKKVCFFLLFFIFLTSYSFAQDSSNTRTVTINSAYNTEYKKVPTANKPNATQTTEDEIIVFSGNVSISVTDGSSVSTVYADEIIYNKTRNTLNATGNVRYERKVDQKLAETFSGKTMLFDIKKMNGVFVDGIVKSDAQKKDQDPYVIHAPIAAKDESGVVAFKSGKLTTSTDDDPLWSIQASRIWLLPGNEMGFANGFFSVGIVPIFYLPFFYYPSDEMIFHPVFGYRSREGYFVQTTSYIIGRKPLAPTTDKNSSGSISNFLQSDSLKEQKRNGLFFQNLDKDASNQNPNYLKIIADGYALLGYLVGIDGKFSPKTPYIDKISFNTYFGFSTTLYSSGTFHTPIDSIGATHHNKSNLFGKTVPFRYSANFEISMRKNPFQLSISTPLISDPFFKSDFLNRKEDMDWFKFMLNPVKPETSTNSGEESSYSWKINGSISPSMSFFSPWLSSFSISNINTTVNFYSKSNTSLTGPERKFYYPQSIKPEFKVSASGTIFSTSMLKSKKTKIESIDVLKELPNPFEPKSNADKNENPTTQEDFVKASENNNDGNSENYINDFIPIYKGTPISETNVPIRYNLSYNVGFDFQNENLYNYEKWNEPKDIDWKDFYYRFYRMQYSTKLDSKLDVAQSLLAVNNSLNFNLNEQRHPWFNTTVPSTKKDTFNLNNFKQSNYKLTGTNSVKVSPFAYIQMFKPTYFEWALDMLLVKNEFIGTTTAPEWEVKNIKWEKDYINRHSFSSVLGMNAGDYLQKISLSANLPPLLSSYSLDGYFAHPYGNISVKTKVFEKESSTKKWFWEPFSMSLNWRLPYEMSLTNTYAYNIEEKGSETFSTRFSYKQFSTYFNMSRSDVYKLNPTVGWQKLGADKKFAPISFGMSFSNLGKPWSIYAWKNRVKFQFGLSTDLNFNFQKITQSYFTFKPEITFAIHEFLDLKISTLSRNDVIARYFQGYLNLPVVLPGETNVIKDLANSFAFWDKPARLSSGFKIKSIDISLVHYLKDWTMNFTYSLHPEKKYDSVTKKTTFEFIPKVTFMVHWKPIGDIKVKTTKISDKFEVERGSIK